MEQLSGQPNRWRTLPVCHPVLTPGIRQSWGAVEHSLTLPAYMKIVDKFTRSDFEKNAKDTQHFIDKGYHDSWLQFYHLIRVAS